MADKVYKLADRFSLFKGDFQEARFYLFNIEDGSMFRLNEVSYDMLSLFDGVTTVDAILSRLKSEYRADAQTIDRDFLTLIDSCLDKGILISGGE
ncbi:PqqD family peptide modification chaperone [Heliobacterium gestii]|uniref:PqqD family peptide modification chaperone n=1 Tax=Heliomicrobium gestii TaxID=2699 RepID=A0A845L4Y4_HELGE|nr:PqqD family protein [Heliomicrobium gestii]MBM7865393.1 hypothetical protein [Heliomicrobium gestii]MZP41652.1 PqqD family peptide modification chaperone [Heliomicrobium gestii]